MLQELFSASLWCLASFEWRCNFLLLVLEIELQYYLGMVEGNTSHWRIASRPVWVQRYFDLEPYLLMTSLSEASFCIFLRTR